MLATIEDTTPTTDIPVVKTDVIPPWVAELRQAPAPQRRRVRPCPHCRRRRRVFAASALAASGLIAFSVLGYAVASRASVSAVRPAAAAEIVLPVKHEHSRPVLPASFGEPHPRAVVVPFVSHASHEHHLAVIAARIAPPVVTVHTTVAASTATTPASSTAVTSSSAPSPSGSPSSAASTVASSSTTPTPTPTPTHTATPSPSAAGSSLGASLLAEAEKLQGVPYVFGGDTAGGVDCSGLVFWAAGQLGITIPRDTFGMLAGSSHLEAVSSPEPGDLAFFGSGHVELYVSPGRFFGAQQTGTLVGFHDYGAYYVPSEYFRLV